MTLLQSAPLEEETFHLPPDLLKTLGIDTLSILIQRVALLVEKGVPPAGLAMALQIWYRTLSGNKFNESIESVTKRANFSRNYALRGLSILMQLNIVTRTKRQGFTDEYEFTDCSQWQKYETPIPEKDTQKSQDNLVQFPTENNSESVETEPVPVRDNPVEDTNNNIVVVSLKDLEEQQQVSVPATDTPSGSPWKYVGQGLPRVYMPPELDQETGSKIESIHEATKRPRQGIIKEAVDLLYNRLNHIPSVLEEKPTPKLTPIRAVAPSVIGIPDEVLVALTNAGIDLGMGAAERLWLKYSNKFEDALAYTVAQDEAGKIRESKSGYFRRSLEEGWNLKISPKQNQKEKEIVQDLGAPEQQAWYEWACATGVCDGKPIRDLKPAWNGELNVFVYYPAPNPMLPPWVTMPISQAMREYPN